MKVYPVKRISLKPILGKKITILGYGSQGRVQALNLRDSGCDVQVGLRRGSRSFQLARRDGIRALEINDAIRHADIISFLVPDECHKEVYEKYVCHSEPKGRGILLFAHGFSIVFREIVPPKYLGIGLVAPKVPGETLRDAYVSKIGLPLLISAHQNRRLVLPIVHAYAKAIGLGLKPVLETTFHDETYGDLFGEQAILCGGLLELVKTAFEVAVQNGLSPEAAYYECLHKLKYVAALFQESGLAGMAKKISHTAHYGGMTRGKRLISPAIKKELHKIYREIKSGEFAKEWLEENRSGLKNYGRLSREESRHPIEETGRRLRKLLE